MHFHFLSQWWSRKGVRGLQTLCYWKCLFLYAKLGKKQAINSFVSRFSPVHFPFLITGTTPTVAYICLSAALHRVWYLILLISNKVMNCEIDVNGSPIFIYNYYKWFPQFFTVCRIRFHYGEFRWATFVYGEYRQISGNL